MTIKTGYVDVTGLEELALMGDLNYRYYSSTVPFKKYPKVENKCVNSYGNGVSVIIDKECGYTHTDRLRLFASTIQSALTVAGFMEVELKSSKLNVSWPIKNNNCIEVPHRDHHDGGWTGFIYLSDSDGDSYLLDKTDNGFKIKETIKYEKGKFVFFPEETYHCGSSPTETFRVVLNVNFWDLNND